MFLDVNAGLGMHKVDLDSVLCPIKNLDIDAATATKVTNGKDGDSTPFYDTTSIGKLVLLKVQTGATDHGRTGIRFAITTSATTPFASNTGVFMEVAEEKYIPVPKGYNLWIVGGDVVLSLIAGATDF